MLSLDDHPHDYKALTKTYMEIFSSSKFTNLLNTTQTGYAHSSHGIEFRIFFKTLFASVFLCTIEITLFCLLRPIFTELYQPRCFCVPITERIERLPRGLLQWIMPTLRTNINTYMSLGLDAYFFIRFLSVLLLFFILIGTLNMLILIPINFTGNSATFSAQGLDKLSISNIADANVPRLNAHFIMGLLIVVIFHWLIIYEFQSFVLIKQSYLLSEYHKKLTMSRTLLITNVPSHLQYEQVLKDIFQTIPGGVKKLWFVYEFEEIDFHVQRAKNALQLLEESQILQMKKYYSLTTRRTMMSRWMSWRLTWTLPWENLCKISWSKFSFKKYPEKKNLEVKFYPPIEYRFTKIPKINCSCHIKLPGWLRIFALQRRVSLIEWALSVLQESQLFIDGEIQKMTNDQLGKHNNVFIEFQDYKGACMANQCLLSQSQGCFDKTFMEVHPQDIIWRNVSRTDGIMCKFENYLVTILFIIITILYVVPVSLVHSISELAVITHMIPFLDWIYQFPEEAKQTISGFLPSIFLTVLTEIVLKMFRFLICFKGKVTGAEVEVGLQKWFFVFLFVQQFLVVTISSSITVVLRQIIDQPTSIPVLLATNLPKSATFFFRYICLRAFALCGNNFLRFTQLVLRNTYYKIIDITPRQKFHRLTKLSLIKWGTTFAVYSIYACIGIAFSIISPLISLFIIFFLSLSILYYKYALNYVYSHINISETMGRLYPNALLHMYTGIYCSECCLIGILFLSKDSSGKCVMQTQGWIMTGVLFVTIFINAIIYNIYSPYFANLPILSDRVCMKEKETKHESSEEATPIDSGVSLTGYNTLYLHPAFKYHKPIVWLPKDPHEMCKLQLEEIEIRSNTMFKGDTKGATLHVSPQFGNIQVTVSGAPPDML